MTHPTDTARLVHTLARALGAQLIETHISWVLLCGSDAWKIKRPLKLPFLDYGTLRRRRICCEEELRLNARLAPDLYLEVTPITGSVLAPVIGGTGRALEYAVHMRRFAPGALFSERLEAGILRPEAVDSIAARLGHFHATAPPAHTDDTHGLPAQRRDDALAALEGTRAAASPGQFALLGEWLRNEASRLTPLWETRRRTQCIRECHGDLHLANLVCLPDGNATAFDCIEFSPSLRFIDVIDDIAFTVMDFCACDRRDLAFRFLNGWLDVTGDHAGLEALPFAIVYRALVRAQVTLLREPHDSASAQRYLDTALRWTQPRPACLVITQGLPASGKTHASQQLLEQIAAIRLRSDVERKRLFGLEALDDSHALGLDLYTAQASQRTYARLLDVANTLLRQGWPVVLDSAFLRRAERDAAHALARAVGLPFHILACTAPRDVLVQRLLARRGDASEADVAVLDKLLPLAEALQADERAWVIQHGERGACATAQPDVDLRHGPIPRTA